MRAGDLLNGYRLISDFTSAGGGLSMWTFAERGGRRYFVKQFLAPKFPEVGSPGTERTKAARHRECERFEQHHRRVADVLRSRCVPGGNLVVTLDFFRVDGIYYKITEAVDVSSIGVREVARLPLDDRLLIMKTATHSLNILHSGGLVHGDVKPDNVLIKQTATGAYTTKLIDFDNCFPANEPPDPDETVGDLVFLSPELAAHLAGEAMTVSTASDIFALGVLFALYLTGRVPVVDGLCAGTHPHERVATGGTARLDGADVPEDLGALVARMLQRESRNRPNAFAVLQALQQRSHVATVAPLVHETRLRGALVDALQRRGHTSGLRGTLTRIRGGR